MAIATVSFEYRHIYDHRFGQESTYCFTLLYCDEFEAWACGLSQRLYKRLCRYSLYNLCCTLKSTVILFLALYRSQSP